MEQELHNYVFDCDDQFYAKKSIKNDFYQTFGKGEWRKSGDGVS